MKILHLLVCLASSSYVWGRGDLESNGPVHALLYSDLFRCSHSENLNLDVSGVRVDFYDDANDFEASFLINSAARGILAIPGLNKTSKFVVFVPGYTSAITLKTRQFVRNSFKNLPDTYVLVLHDFLYTNPLPDSISSYKRSVLLTYYIGKALADALIVLRDNGVSSKNVHLIGHSLGAHIVGYTGRIFLERTGTKINRITGLDPAGPCYGDLENQLKSGEADFVDVYHCNANEYGTSAGLGDVNFFVNNGVTQPGCGTPPVPDFIISAGAALCSHMACQNFYFATVNQPNLFSAVKCNSYNNFRTGNCNNNEHVVAGYWTPASASGFYYISTANYNIAY